MRRAIRLSSLLLVLLGILALLAVACGDDEDEPGPTNQPAGGTATGAAGTPATSGLKTGAAGIAKNPRTVRGLDAWTGLTQSLDDGLAIWKTRPSSENRTGITKDTIKLGQSAIISGPAASVEACWGPIGQAILKRINEAGGIHGRSIQWIKYDDGLNPAVTVNNIKKLVEQDKIFATFFSENTAGHQATRSYLEEQKILELFPTDADPLSIDPPWPYYVGTFGSGSLIGYGYYADYIKQNMPNAKVALITSDTANQQVIRDSFKAAAQKQGVNIVFDGVAPAAQVDLSSQVQQAISSGADVLLSFALPQAQPNVLTALRQTFGNRTMKTMAFGTPPVKELSPLYAGDISAYSSKDVLTDPGLPLWGQMEKLAAEENARWCPSGVSTVSVMNAIEFLVRALEAAGPDPTREGVMEGIKYAFDGYNCTMCLAPTYLSYVDNIDFEVFQFSTWNATENKRVPTGQPISYETSAGKSPRGNDPKYGCTVPDRIKALNLPNYPSTLCPWKTP